MSKNILIKNNSILIVGGTGFIGSHIVKEALIRGLQVAVISKNHKPLSDRLKGVEYLCVDISQKDKLHNELKDKQFQYVVNLGGYVNHSNYSSGGDKVFDVHFNGAKNLINFLNKDVLKSFIQIGSSDEYGINSAPQNENQREAPISPYSFTKTATTQFLQMLYRTEELPTVTLRLFLVYGIGQDDKRFIPQIIKGWLSDSSISTSAGGQLRDFCYVNDITDGIIKALTNDNVNGKVINLASGNPITIRKVVELVQKTVGKGTPVFGEIAYRVGENMKLYADISRAKNILKWKPSVTVEQGIEWTVDAYRR